MFTPLLLLLLLLRLEMVRVLVVLMMLLVSVLGVLIEAHIFRSRLWSECISICRDTDCGFEHGLQLALRGDWLGSRL